MILKKFHNSFILGKLTDSNSYYLKTIEECNNSRQKENDTIEKYKLNNKKFKLI